VYKLTDVKQVHLEITQNCPASCSMCDRNQNGGEVNPHINLSELSLDDCKKIFSAEFIKQLDTMYMCGNLGDPIVAKDTLAVFEYFRYHNPKMWLSMNTNGGARDSQWWADLANVYGRYGAVIFSIDGLEDTNHIYRQNVNWNKVKESFTSFISEGGRARWDFLIFEHNQHQVVEAEILSKEFGFERFVAKKTGRFITAKSEKKDVHWAIDKKRKNTVAIKKPKDEFQNPELKKYDHLVETYGSIDSYYDQANINCKVKDAGSLFISAEGLALPCCWTAGRMYKWWNKDPKVEQIWNFIDRAGGKESLDARRGLDKVFETGMFDQIENSWSLKSCNEGKLKVCAMKCGEKFDPFAGQYQ